MSGVKDRKQDIIKDKTVHYIEDNAERIKLGVLVIDGPALRRLWIAGFKKPDPNRRRDVRFPEGSRD